MIEPGVTTSEWKAIIGAAAANTVALAVAFGVHLSAGQQAAVLACVGSYTALAGLYAVGRSIRKRGTNEVSYNVTTSGGSITQEPKT